ncbi:MAG: Asp-tRNA(Asn)/Glu-tRNA(Gln) amidotransferase subunit GatB [Candidatus Lernaella stagnicola]|nr:Asp-tRNA(Asn)/Glu-tRNA(Gln) amidotransferase subunit GatB [Candidatus Lernaella stagnicola]
MSWEMVIGLEVHVQLATATKAFCRCPNRFGDEPNRNVCPVCLGLPGALPVATRDMVEQGARLALALGADVREHSAWVRKNYFYPDLPKGYQITQFEFPLAVGGELPLRDGDGRVTAVGLERLHLEEDAGKLLHGEGDAADFSFVDFNRCGAPLVEIVSRPNLRRPEDAASFLRELRRLVVRLGVSDGNMEEGSLRCDANISVRRRGESAFRTRAEIKNLNSFRFVKQALEFEAKRQIDVYENGGRVVQETRWFDSRRGVTHSMRSKEEAHDYRYFPEPDLPPLVLDRTRINAWREALPELPWHMHERFVRQYGLSHYDAALLSDDAEVAAFFEEVATQADPKQAANWINGELAAVWKARDGGPAKGPISAADVSELLNLIANGAISGKIGKDVLAATVAGEGSPAQVVRQRGWMQIRDVDTLRKIIREVLAAHPKQVAAYRAGETKLLGFFVGRLMERTAGRANPQLANELIAAELRETD